MATKNALLGQFGVYHLASLLCKSGYTAVTTSRNAEAADLLVFNHCNGKAIGLQVKTVRQQHKTDLEHDLLPVTTTTSEKLNTIGFFTPFVFVYIPTQASTSCRYFFIPGKDVARLLREAWAYYLANSKHKKPISELGLKPFLACLHLYQCTPFEIDPNNSDSWSRLGLD